MPGRTMERIFSSAPQPLCPAWYIFSGSFGDLQMTSSPRRARKNLTQCTTDFFHTLRAIHGFQNTVLAVVIRQRFRLALVGCQALFHDSRGIIRPLNQFPAIYVANPRHFRRMLVNIVGLTANAAG